MCIRLNGNPPQSYEALYDDDDDDESMRLCQREYEKFWLVSKDAQNRDLWRLKIEGGGG